MESINPGNLPHAKRVHVHTLVIVLFVHLGRHELWRADDWLGKGAIFEGGETQITNLHGTSGPRNENIVTFQVSG